MKQINTKKRGAIWVPMWEISSIGIKQVSFMIQAAKGMSVIPRTQAFATQVPNNEYM